LEGFQGLAGDGAELLVWQTELEFEKDERGGKGSIFAAGDWEKVSPKGFTQNQGYRI